MDLESLRAQLRLGKSAERQWPRFKVDFSVRLLVNAQGGKTLVQGRGHDLGEGGMAVYAAAELSEGQQIQIEFTPPYSRKPLTLSAVVRDRSGNRYGLEFRKLSHLATQELSRACRALSVAAE